MSDFSTLTYKIKIKKKIAETSDTYSFVFEIPTELKAKFKYKAGQFVTLALDLDRQHLRRSYSLSSSPDCDNSFAFTVKKVLGGVVSTYLCDTAKEGDVLSLTPPAGRFCLPDFLENRTFVFFAAGSGITPIFSLIKSALHKDKTTKIFLLYGSRNKASIIFSKQIEELKLKFSDRFVVDHVLSLPEDAWSGLHGRISGPMIETYLKNHKIPKDAVSFLCGPEGFMATVQSALELHGFMPSAIIRESFSSIITSNEMTETIGEGVTYIGDQGLLSPPEKIVVELSGEQIEFTPKEGVTILESLLDDGHNPPYSCMNGSCMACIGKVRDGLVYQNDLGILTEDNVAAKECLTCQSYPASKNVKISYDF